VNVTKDSWTPVEEGLPEYMTVCLVFCPDNENIFCAYYHFYAGSRDREKIPIWCFFDNDERILEVKERVTHWREMPNLPTAFL
jgi:hypothetical protein